MVSRNTANFLFSFNSGNFAFLSSVQYSDEITKAEARAYYILSTSATKTKNPGWGISVQDLDDDESGQLQVALEMLTASEFLKRLHGLYPDYASLGSYSSPTGESLSLSPDQLEALLKQAEVMRNKAYEAALPYIADEWKNTGAALSASNYDWQILEKEYIEEIEPLNPLDYKLRRTRGYYV